MAGKEKYGEHEEGGKGRRLEQVHDGIIQHLLRDIYSMEGPGLERWGLVTMAVFCFASRPASRGEIDAGERGGGRGGYLVLLVCVELVLASFTCPLYTTPRRGSGRSRL